MLGLALNMYSFFYVVVTTSILNSYPATMLLRPIYGKLNQASMLMKGKKCLTKFIFIFFLFIFAYL